MQHEAVLHTPRRVIRRIAAGACCRTPDSGSLLRGVCQYAPTQDVSKSLSHPGPGSGIEPPEHQPKGIVVLLLTLRCRAAMLPDEGKTEVRIKKQEIRTS